jgi:predicted RNase H-like HicB family nuclease
MNYKIEIEQEEDGRYIAEIVELPGVLVYGNSQQEAISKVQALANSIRKETQIAKSILDRHSEH